MQRRVVSVFGGSGFVGRHFVRRMTADGWIVRVGVRDTEAASFLRISGEAGQVVPMLADVTDPASVATLVQGAHAVVNLVGILYERGRRTFERIHVEGATNVARAARAAGVERLIQMSAIGANVDSIADYARTKAEGEASAHANFPGASITRPSVIFGPDDDFFNRFARMARIMPVLPVFPARFQPVYVVDVAEAMARIIGDADTAGNTYELGGPEVVTFREVMERMLRQIGRDRFLLPLPLSIAEIQAWFLQKLPVPPLTVDQVRMLAEDNVVAPGALTLEDLGITPTGMDVVLPTYLARFRPQAKQQRRVG